MRLSREGALTATLVVCALLTTGLIVRRELFSPAQAAYNAAEQGPIRIPHWQDYAIKGERMGPANATVQLIEFADFECPYCGSFHKTLKALREHYPTQVSLIYMHFPLQGHRFAIPAARVAECAREQGRFEALYDRLFDEQDSLGLKSWADYATEAGVPDLKAFNACASRTETVSRIEVGRQLGAKLDVKGTPTLIINGWMLARPPSAKDLDDMVKAVLAGKSPVEEGHKS
jgi:protein-disulfide isomerase